MKAFRNQLLAWVLLCLLNPTSLLAAAVCDVDDDGDIDRNDIRQIALARNTSVEPGDPRDADGNGIITILDARACTFQCDLSRCTSIDPPVEVPTISVSPDSLDFGDVLVGSSSNLALLVNNTGTATLSVSNITSSVAPFSITPPTSFAITAGGAAQSVQVNFSPVAAGDFNGTVTITSNADNIDPVEITVTGRGVEPQVNVPTIDVSPDPLNFGDVFVGSSLSLPLAVENTGNATLNVSNITSSGAPYSVFPPRVFDITNGGLPRNVDIDFSPAAEGLFEGTITINSNADNVDPVLVAVTGRGVLPPPAAEPDIDSATSLIFGAIPEGASVEQQLTITNVGDAPLNVSDVTSDNPDYTVAALPGQNIPFTLDPGVTQNVVVIFTAPAGSAGTTVTGALAISSDDPDESSRTVSLAANVIPADTLDNIPILGASVDATIDLSNCSNVSGSVLFGASPAVDSFNVTLTDQNGVSATSPVFNSDAAGGPVAFSGIDTCPVTGPNPVLDDGILELSVILGSFDPYIGTPAIKNTSALLPPVLAPVATASVAQEIEICGTSREDTTVKIEGGVNTVTIQLDDLTTEFCLDVTLRPNTENTLIATAIDDIATAPKPVASASPIQVTHVDPSAIIIAEASSRPLTVEEIEELVDNGVIDLDDPSNFNVSMFTIVLTIGSFPVTVSQPVPVPTSPGVGYGGGSVGWTGGGGGGSGGSSSGGGSVCVTGCSNIIVIKTPSGQTIPGVIIIDGRIKTLKEFFQVTIAIQNTSTGFVLTDMVANIVLPAGLSPVKAGPGTDVFEINTDSALDTVDIGDINAGQTGTGQFIIRGDGIGTHSVDVDFNGFLTGGGLALPEPVSGSASTSVQVYGPPTFDVVVRHPSNPGLNNDVNAGEIYDLIVEIKNTSSRPALYTSLELFVGGQAELVDGFGTAIPGSNQITSFGTIPAGRAVEAAFRVRSSLQGEIIACQAIASENISLTVDTGPDGTSCNIANTYPANFEALPADQPPVVIGINPLNGQTDIVVTSSVVATLTPESCNIVGDTFNNIVTAPIDPSNLPLGDQVISADLLQAGTFYLEELDPFNNPVKHIPTDLTIENPPAGGTTIAVLRLGLASPLTQYFLRDNTTYRATLVGGPGGIRSCSLAAAEMVSSYSWTFSTEQTCVGISDPIASMSAPPDGSVDRPLNQSIVLDFTNRMDPSSFTFLQNDIPGSSFGIYVDALVSGDDISTGSEVPGSGVFSNLGQRLTYTAIPDFANDKLVQVRLTDGLRDICGNPLQTPNSGVQLLSFQTIPPDTTEPLAPVVNPVPAITNLPTAQLSGQAEASSTVEISGGSAVVTTTASGAGNFSVSVPLNLNATNNFSVRATDASGNTSEPPATTDNNGDSLTTVQDNVLPTVVAVFPVDGETAVARDIIISADFDEDIDPATINDLNFTLEGSVIPGTLAAVGNDGFSFTPDNLLDFNTTYNIRIRADGMRDLAGNGLSSEFVSSFTTQNFPLPSVNSVAPDNGLQGTTFVVTFTGTDLATASAVISDNPDITGTIGTATDTSVTANITIDALAAPGLTTLGLTTLGGSASLPFTVLQKAPVINAITPDTGLRGTTVNAQLVGSGLSNPDVITIDGTGVTISERPGSTDAVLNVELVIAADAALTARTITVTTAGGVATVGFGVVRPLPVISSITPNAGVQGQSVNVQIDGTGFTDLTAITIDGSGVTLTDLGGGTDTALQIRLDIDIGATLGARTITVTTIGGEDEATFQVLDNAISLTPPALGLATRTSADLTVNLPLPAGVGGQVVTLASSNTLVVTVPASVTVPEGLSSVTFPASADVDAGSSTVTASAAGLDPDSSTINVSLRSFALTAPLVGLDRIVTGTITLTQPAPVGGATFQMSVADPIATITSPVIIAEGDVVGTFELQGGTQGATIVTADGTASGYTLQTLPVTVTNRLIDIPALQNLTLGETRDFQVLISPDAAPPGGVPIVITSSDPTIIEVLTSTVTVPAGGFSTTGQIRAKTDVTGDVSLFASNPGFAPDVGNASVTANLDILESFANFDSAETDTIFFRLTSAAASFPAPAPGVDIALTSADTTCVAVAASTTVATGDSFATAELSYGGTAALPCTTTVSANTPVFGSDSVSVTVGIAPDLGTLSVVIRDDADDVRLGLGLQSRYRLNLPTGSHGGVIVQLMSSDENRAVLAADATTPGLPVLELTIPNGTSAVDFFIQGERGATLGPVDIVASSPRFNDGTLNLEIVAPVLDLVGLNPTTTTLTVEDPFYVRTGIRNSASDTSFRSLQEVAPGAPLTVTFTTSDLAVAALKTDPASPGEPGTVTVQIQPNQSNSPTTVAAGGAALDPLGGVSTVVSATAAGFDFTAGNGDGYVQDEQTVTVNTPAITIGVVQDNDDDRLGQGLQSIYRVSLGASDHGGVTVALSVDDPTAAVLSLSPTVAGAVDGTLNIDFADGQTSTNFYIQAQRGVVDTDPVTPAPETLPVVVSASQASFSSGTFNLEVVVPVLDLVGLTATTTSLSVDDAFYVRTGIRNSASDISFRSLQEVAPGAPLTVVFTTSDPAVAALKTDPASPGEPGTVTVQIQPNQSNSPTTVAAGGAALDPLGGVSTVVSATAAGFDFTAGNGDGYVRDEQTVTVNTPTITLGVVQDNDDDRLGQGLQSLYRVSLGASDHGGVTVALSVDDPTAAVLSLSPTVAGAVDGTLNIDFADGQTSTNFYIQAQRGVVDTDPVTPAPETLPVVVSASQASFSSGTFNLEVVVPVLDLVGLTATTTSLSNDDAFYVRTGIRNSASDTILRSIQEVAPGAPLTVVFTTSDPAVAALKTDPASPGEPGTVTVQIQPNQSNSPTTVAAGGAALDPLGGVSTVVSATAAGFDFTAGNSDGYVQDEQTVTVNTPTITIGVNDDGDDDRLGQGLQSIYRVSLGASDHGGVTVALSVDDPTAAVLSLSPTVAGAVDGTLNIDFADGQTSTNFYIQAQRGVVDTDPVTPAPETLPVVVSASQASFSSGTFNLEVVVPVLDLVGLTATTTSLSVDDAFYVRTGIRNSASDTILRSIQEVAPGAPLTVVFTTSDPAVAALKTDPASPGEPGTVTVQIQPNQSNSPTTVAAGGAALDPLGGVSTVVSATAAGFDFTAGNGDGYVQDEQTVTVNTPTITIGVNDDGDDDRLGQGLQSRYRVSLETGNHGGATVRVLSSESLFARVAPDATTLGAPFIDIAFSPGETSKTFFIQALPGVVDPVAGSGVPVTITASEPRYSDGNFSLIVVEPILDIINLATTVSSEDAFEVRTGIRNSSSDTSFRSEQEVSVAAPALAVTLEVDNVVTATLTTTANPAPGAGSLEVLIAPGASRSPTTVPTGGVALLPQNSGSVTVSATASGFDESAPLDTLTVTVP